MHSRPRLSSVRSAVSFPHDDAFGVPASDGAASGVVGAVLYADRQLRLTYHPHPSATLIQLIGEVDFTNGAALEETLRRAGHGDDRLLVDLRHLRFIDTGGMRLLARLCSTGAVRLVNVPPYLRRLADLLDLPLRISTPDGTTAHDPR
ncbi:STAS domain-containing protein [Planomonospora sp. ID67723]|uniref:STAS domain-containing protein n=1 Tax=Planomonospora sp. ID67723 TaxID=2738134 RepID=UPI0018C3D02B|nr:STAS domain-containing protein [Planomonospora sp. ID67723]MBG0830061.1 STAS domain-containing protein [Planomonospora sp. ID67723]